jgi:hypothetical protein
MRTGTRWHRQGRARSVEEIGDAAAVAAFRCARTMLAGMRKARFDIEPGPRYFDFLAEALAFVIQCACRLAWPRLEADERQRFATALALAAARHLAESEASLLGERTVGQAQAAFIERLNRRFGEYAELDYGGDEPGFAFLRYFASLVVPIVPPDDARWVHDQVIAIEAPAAAATLARTLRGLLEEH